jgi:hypothetical protein
MIDLLKLLLNAPSANGATHTSLGCQAQDGILSSIKRAEGPT